MSRFYTVAALGMVAVSAAFASRIEVGSNTTGGVSTGGLNSAYFGGSFPVVAAGNTAVVERTYATTLFAGETLTSSSLGGSTLPDSPGNQQLTDTNNSVTFGLISGDGVNTYLSGGLGFPGGSGSASPQYTSSISIPVGVFGVDQAWILLNDQWGVNGAPNDTVTFTFTGAGAPAPLVVNLTEGNQIRTVTACGSASSTFTSGGVHGGSTDCTTFATSATNASVAWSAHYNNTTSNSTPFSGTSGTVALSDISFDLSAYSAYTLSNISIADAGTGYDTSRLALSAVTLDQLVAADQLAATPEPASMATMIAGLGLIGFVTYRRRG